MALDQSTIGLLMEISADPAKAQAGLDSLKSRTQAVTQAMAGNFSSLSSSIESSLGSALGPAGVVLAGLGGLGAGLLEVAHKASQAGDAIFAASEKTGLAAPNLSGLKALSKETGENFDSLTMALARAGRNLQVAIDQPGLQSSKVLESVMGSAQNLAALGLKPMDERLQIVLQHIFALNDVGQRNEALNTLLGRGWMTNIETLKLLAEQGYGPAIEQAKKLGYYFDEGGAAKAHQFEMTLNTVKASLSGLGVELGQKLIPFFLDLYLAVFGLAPAFQGLELEVEGQIALLASLGSGVMAVVHDFAALGAAVMLDFSGVKDELKKAAVEVQAMGDNFKDAWKKTGEGIDKLGQVDEYTKQLKQHLDDLAKGAAKAGDKFLHLGNTGAAGVTAAKEYTDALEKQLQADREVAEGLESGELPARQRIITEINREIEARTREINSYRALAAAHKITMDELATREQEYTADVATLARERDDKIRASDAAIVERLKSQLLPAVEGVDKAYQDYFQTIAQIVQVSSGADRAFLTNLANAKLLDDTMKTLTADADALAKSMAATFEKSGMPAQLAGAAAAFSPLTGAIKLTQDQLGQLVSQSTLDINKWAADQGISTEQVQQDYIRMVLGMKTQLGISKTDLYNWQQDMQTDFSLVRTAATVFSDMATEDLQKFSSALGQSAANAIVSGSNIARAVEQAVKSTLTSIAGEAAVRALYNTGLGFYYLAIQDYADAALAFDAAAVFGTIAGVAGGIAAALPGGGAGTGAGAGAGGRGGFGSGASEISATGLTRAQQQSFLAPGSAGALRPPPPPTVINVDASGAVFAGSDAGAAIASIVNPFVEGGGRFVSSHSVYGAAVSRGRP